MKSALEAAMEQSDAREAAVWAAEYVRALALHREWAHPDHVIGAIASADAVVAELRNHRARTGT